MTPSEEIFQDGSDCMRCQHQVLEHDPFGTGDSPTLRGCSLLEETDQPCMFAEDQK